MKKLIAMTLLLGGSTLLCAQKTVKIPAVYKPVKSEMYKKGWIDFNKNGVKDVYEDPNASLDARIEDLLSQMTLEEKTCQMVTLYGYKRVLKDDLPTPEWKELLWKDGIGAIDRLTHHFHAGKRRKNEPEALTNQILVIGNGNPNGCAAARLIDARHRVPPPRVLRRESCIRDQARFLW